MVEEGADIDDLAKTLSVFVPDLLEASHSKKTNGNGVKGAIKLLRT